MWRRFCSASGSRFTCTRSRPPVVAGDTFFTVANPHGLHESLLTVCSAKSAAQSQLEVWGDGLFFEHGPFFAPRNPIDARCKK
mmetsp:Transcript_25944/g.39898  ORF Transcript_25944/g.39898 Transcript_25944/m.39898 type:complete len:83 (+) Transcript_25944:1321-1569(+)